MMFNLLPTSPCFSERSQLSFLFLSSTFSLPKIYLPVSFVLLYYLSKFLHFYSLQICCWKTVLMASNLCSHCPVWYIRSKFPLLLISTNFQPFSSVFPASGNLSKTIYSMFRYLMVSETHYLISNVCSRTDKW